MKPRALILCTSLLCQTDKKKKWPVLTPPIKWTKIQINKTTIDKESGNAAHSQENVNGPTKRWGNCIEPWSIKSKDWKGKGAVTKGGGRVWKQGEWICISFRMGLGSNELPHCLLPNPSPLHPVVSLLHRIGWCKRARGPDTQEA